MLIPRQVTCISEGCTNPCSYDSARCVTCQAELRKGFKDRRMEAKPKSLLENDFVLAAGDISVTSQGNKIVLTKRDGKVYTKLCEIEIEQAFALGIAMRSVATCLKYVKGE